MTGGIKKIYKRVENTDISILNIIKDKAQVETYYYLVDEFLTPKEIAKKRKCTISAVYKSINKLMKKGLIKGGYKNEYLKGGEYSVKHGSSNKYRLSALAYTIEIIENSFFYENILKRKNQDNIDNNTLMLQPTIITIYLNKDFFGDTEQECSVKAANYINRFIVILENNYRLVLSKGKKRYLKEFRCEIEKLNDPFAKKKRLEKNKLIIKDLEDGKARIITDFSFKIDSLEAVKKDKSRKDIRRIDKIWNELLDSDISLIELKDIIINQNNLITGLIKTNQSQKKKLEYLTDIIGNMVILQNNTQQQLHDILKYKNRK